MAARIRIWIWPVAWSSSVKCEKLTRGTAVSLAFEGLCKYEADVLTMRLTKMMQGTALFMRVLTERLSKPGNMLYSLMGISIHG